MAMMMMMMMARTATAHAAAFAEGKRAEHIEIAHRKPERMHAACSRVGHC